METIRRIALALVIIGAINWGLIGFFQFDLVASIFGGQDAALSRLVYALVGISGLISLGILFRPDEEPETNQQRFTNPNLNTELGEEPDFSKEKDAAEKKSAEKKSDPNNHQGPLM